MEKRTKINGPGDLAYEIFYLELADVKLDREFKARNEDEEPAHLYRATTSVFEKMPDLNVVSGVCECGIRRSFGEDDELDLECTYLFGANVPGIDKLPKSQIKSARERISGRICELVIWPQFEALGNVIRGQIGIDLPRIVRNVSAKVESVGEGKTDEEDLSEPKTPRKTKRVKRKS